jgi:hypothetical protein
MVGSNDGLASTVTALSFKVDLFVKSVIKESNYYQNYLPGHE